MKPSLRKTLAPATEAHMFQQYLFFGQWRELRTYAASKGVEIIGDIPIFVALDSADVWANPTLFKFDTKRNRPLAVAGCASTMWLVAIRHAQLHRGSRTPSDQRSVSPDHLLRSSGRAKAES